MTASRGRGVGVLACAVWLLAGGIPARGQELGPCAACVALVVPSTEVAALPDALGGLDVLIVDGAGAAEGLALVAARGGRPGLLVGDQPVPLVATRLTAAAVVLLDARDSRLEGEALVYALRTRLTAARAAAPPDVEIGVALPNRATATVARPLAPYVDFVAAGDDPGGGTRWWRLVDRPLTLDTALESTRSGQAERWLFELADLATSGETVGALAAAAPWLTRGLVPATDLGAACDGEKAPVFLDPATLDRVALLPRCPAATDVKVEPPQPFERRSIGPGASLIRVPSPEGERFADAVTVAAARQLTVEEVVANHQASTARQARRVRTLMASGSLTVSFEAPGFPAPVTVSSRTTLFRDEETTDLAQRDIRVNGMALGGDRVPRLPILEPERVSAPPLTITLTDRYQYRLDGLETRAGVPAYVVAFEPVDGRDSLFRGRAWIAADDFGLVRVEAVQTGLTGPIVSSEQIDEFSRETGVWLLARSEVRQSYRGPAYQTPIHRVLALATREVNAADFARRRAEAYRTAPVLLRDTAEGYRYLERRPAATAAAAGAEASQAPAEPTLEVVAASSRVRALLFGAIFDPNISRPLPFAGLSYVDFDLFGSGVQFSGFFGGTYGQAAFMVPSLGGTRWQLAGRAFGIASSYNDRDFDGGQEQYDRSVRQRPAHVSVWTLRPLTERLQLRVGYELDYTALSATSLTADDFQVPADQVVHGLRLQLDVQRGGWDGSLWWNPARRQGWRGWGRPGDYAPSERDFQRAGASAGRTLIVSPSVVLKGEAAVMTGHDLDRFSRYSFGTFDNRLHGYPSALIRYDRGAVLRTSASWSPLPLARFDAFADLAFVRDRGFDDGISRFPGFGVALEAPAPFGILAAAEWGYGVEGINSDGRRGTHVVRLSAYKVF